MGMASTDDNRNAALIVEKAIIAELHANCFIALEAWNSIQFQATLFGNSILSATSDAARRRLVEGLWGAAYSMIGASCRISRILWKSKGCKELRTRFGVPESSPIREGHKVRDVLEHIETRILDFALQSPGKYLAGWSIGNNPETMPEPNAVVLRFINLSTWSCRAYDPRGDRECNIAAIARAIQALNLALPETVTWVQKVGNYDLEFPEPGGP
jgi:hypothetical protein